MTEVGYLDIGERQLGMQNANGTTNTASGGTTDSWAGMTRRPGTTSSGTRTLKLAPTSSGKHAWPPRPGFGNWRRSWSGTDRADSSGPGPSGVNPSKPQLFTDSFQLPPRKGRGSPKDKKPPRKTPARKPRRKAAPKAPGPTCRPEQTLAGVEAKPVDPLEQDRKGSSPRSAGSSTASWSRNDAGRR